MTAANSDRVVSFEEWLSGKPEQPLRPSVAPPPPEYAASDTYRDRVHAALAERCTYLAGVQHGRRHSAVIETGKHCFCLALGANIDTAWVAQQLDHSCQINGHTASRGQTHVDKDIADALNYAEAEGPRYLEDRPNPRAPGGGTDFAAPDSEPTAMSAATDNRPPDQAHSGQVRIAYRLHDLYEDQLLHVHGIGWHHWDGNRWAYDDSGAAHRAVLDVLRSALTESLDDKQLRADVRKCESSNGIAGTLTVAAALPSFAATVRDLDADPYLLNVANGTLDLRTMEFRDHDPADRMTKVTRAAYDPAAPSSTWSAFLERVLPDEPVRDYLQRLAGVALLGKVAEHVLPILTGTGANGKSVLCKTMMWALGSYASTVEPDLLMHHQGAHPTGEMDLLGRRLVVVSESERDRRLAEATMKRLTGGDTIRARRMRQDFIEFEPSHLPLLITNHLPKVSGDDPAIWRRLRVVPFTVEIPPGERDPHLDERLQVEADAVLAWAVRGWEECRSRGGLDEPQAVLVATDDYQKASDAVARFIDECCLTGSPVNKATTKQLFAAWDKWRSTDGAEQISQKAFAQALDAKGYPALKGTGGTRWRNGIALVADQEQTP